MFPYLFKYGNFEIRFYSLMYIIAIIIAIYFSKRKGEKIGLSKVVIENAVIITFMGAIIGARLYYVLLRWDIYSNTPFEMFAVWHGGLAIHGGIVGGAITAYFYCRLKKLQFLMLGDLTLPFLLLGQGIGRLGNFFNGEAHGVPTIIPLSIIFRVRNIFPDFWNNLLLSLNLENRPEQISMIKKIIADNNGLLNIFYKGKEYILKEYVPWGISFSEKYMPPAYLDFGSLPVHPTFFYEMIFNFIGAFILIFIWKNNSNIGRGSITAFYFIFYALIRSFVTFFRADDLMIGFIRAPHLTSIVMLIIGLTILIYIEIRKKEHNPS